MDPFVEYVVMGGIIICSLLLLSAILESFKNEKNDG